MGQQYDDPKSKAHIAPFVKAFKLDGTLLELKEPDITKYSCFNAFFSRALKDTARPITESENALVYSSPADCRMVVFKDITSATHYWIKGHAFTIRSLIGDSVRALQYDEGSLAIARLAPQDYHRWHSPCDGTITAIYELPGTYYTVNPQAINEAGTLNVFCENRRSVMFIRLDNLQQIVVIAVGAMLVGSIMYEPGIKHDLRVKRGQCLGRFQYGGSTVIVLYPPKVVEFDRDLVTASMTGGSDGGPCETLMKVGWRMGVGSPPSRLP